MYGKLSGNSIMPAPYYVERNGDNIFGYNLDGNSEMLLQDGYKPVVDSDTPPQGFISPRKVWTENKDNIVASWVDEYVPPLPPTDDDIIATRKQLYATVSDPMFNSYDQGGPTTLSEAIASKAQIQFDNKKSDQAGMSLADFVHKVNAEYTLSHKHNVPNEELSYKYQETNGIDQVDIGSETINLVRATVSSNVQLPKITKVQTVKVDNTSEDSVSLLPFSGDFIDGLSSELTVAGKTSVEVIADVASGSWDIYTPPTEQEQFNGIRLSDLLGNEANDVTDVELGMGIRLSQPSAGKAKLELDLESLGIADEPPCYYASIANNETLTDNNGDIIHDGIVWYDDVIVANKTNYFDIDRANKAIGIQETDDKDPNVTGGMAYLVIYRSVMSGKADEDGFIESAVRDRDSQEILADANGTAMAVYKGYSAGDKYKTMRIAYVVEAKNLVYLQHHLLDNFATKKTISLQPYTRGNSCMVIQGLTKDNRTGKALMKYEQDTGEKVLIDYVWDENAKKFVWLLKGFETVDEKQMQFVDDRAILFNPKPKNTPYRFSLTNTYKKVPFGIIKSGNIPFDLVGWANTEGYEYGNENDLVADDDMDIEVLAQPNLHVVAKEPIYMCLTEKVGENYNPIQGTEVVYNPKALHEVAPTFPMMKAKIKNSQTIGVAMKSTTPNGAYIETDNPQFSLITFTITAKGAV